MKNISQDDTSKRGIDEVELELKNNMFVPDVQTRKPVRCGSGKRTVTCSVCGEIGHNKRYHKIM
jgi:hypothetical protein